MREPDPAHRREARRGDRRAWPARTPAGPWWALGRDAAGWCHDLGGRCGRRTARERAGERLATWLEQLGLSAHLATAGLPTFTRDESGRAAWTDPGTGEPLTEHQLLQLDALLHSDGTEPQHAVPVQLLQLARQAWLREQLLASPWHTYATLAELRGATTEATRFAVHKAGGEHRLLVVAEGERTLVPAFQLTTEGEPRPDLAPSSRRCSPPGWTRGGRGPG